MGLRPEEAPKGARVGQHLGNMAKATGGASISIYLSIDRSIYFCMYVCVCVYTHTHTHTYIYMYIYISLYIYIHTYKCIQGHIYTHTCSDSTSSPAVTEVSHRWADLPAAAIAAYYLGDGAAGEERYIHIHR